MSVSYLSDERIGRLYAVDPWGDRNLRLFRELLRGAIQHHAEQNLGMLMALLDRRGRFWRRALQREAPLARRQ